MENKTNRKRLEAGDSVEIFKGSLKGLTASFIRTTGRRAKMSLVVHGQVIAVELSRGHIRPVTI